MKKLIWGIIIAVLGVLFLASAGQNPQGPAGSIVVGMLCLGGGGVMIYFGARNANQRKAVVGLALQLLRKEDKINAGEVARVLGMSEITARQYIAEAQRQGIIPLKADVV